MALIDKIMKNNSSEHAAIITESKVYGDKEDVSVDVPMLNVAMSGLVNKGMVPGIHMIAGPSKHFKTAFSLLMAKHFQDKFEDGWVIMFDTEFGSPPDYLENAGLDTNRIYHVPITSVEDLKFHMIEQLDGLDKGDHVFFLIDSIGNVASNKEIEDARDKKSKADMTRAKSLKSFFRMVTSTINLKDFYMVPINHSYKEIGLYPKDIVSGGTGGIYGANTIWLIGRRQDKDTKGHHGYEFIINIEKSRFIREGKKIPITVNFENGIKKWSGLTELAENGGFITKVTAQSYQITDPETGEILSDEKYKSKTLIDNDELWEHLLKNSKLPQYIHNYYSLTPSEIEEKFEEEIEKYEEEDVIE